MTREGPDPSGGPVGGRSTVVDAGKADGSNFEGAGEVIFGEARMIPAIFVGFHVVLRNLQEVISGNPLDLF